jgi:alpha-ribazole phosphatase/probable phosphoglycerate mutase
MSYSTPIAPGTTLLLIRHAQSTMSGRFCGHSDAPLSEAGREQLPHVVRCLERWPVTRVYTSDLKRAYDTAAAIATGRSLPLVMRPGLREINFGAWEGRSWEEIEATDPAGASAWLAQYPLLAAPGGQSLSDYRMQVESELAAIRSESDGHCAAVVTHGGFIRTALATILGIPEKSMHRIEVEHGGVTALNHSGGSWALRGVNLL